MKLFSLFLFSLLLLSCGKKDTTPVQPDQLTGHLYSRYLMNNVINWEAVYHNYSFYTPGYAESYTSEGGEKDYNTVDTVMYSITGAEIAIDGKAGTISQDKIAFPDDTISVPGTHIPVVYDLKN
jgi:hypothetical protein